jgi:hypothetical protein
MPNEFLFNFFPSVVGKGRAFSYDGMKAKIFLVLFNEREAK